jgi:SAM-dependent methyltransferase
MSIILRFFIKRMICSHNEFLWAFVLFLFILSTLSFHPQYMSYQPPHIPVPPPELASFGGGNFVAVGNEFFGYLVRYAGLRPHERVLDVGCGIGRMAVPLTTYLSPGSYEGFDVATPAIDWCQRAITPFFPQCHFQHVNVKNGLYNPQGTIDPHAFVFPYPDASFDLVFLTSVFTHMLEEETRHYVQEISRVLRPGGRMLATFFLENAESKKGVMEQRSALKFQYPCGSCTTTNPHTPEDAILYPESLAMSLCEEQGLRCRAPLYGNWSGRTDALSFQDILIADRI